jgi:hypothetical protein
MNIRDYASKQYLIINLAACFVINKSNKIGCTFIAIKDKRWISFHLFNSEKQNFIIKTKKYNQNILLFKIMPNIIQHCDIKKFDIQIKSFDTKIKYYFLYIISKPFQTFSSSFRRFWFKFRWREKNMLKMHSITSKKLKRETPFRIIKQY